ncbi:MAG: HlyC/CorC family transporter [Phycisphaerales bacterium]|nr:HlyC/CorC family transporter [Phycisphaerales bacterium]
MLLFVVAVAVSLLFSFVCSLCEAAVLSVSAARVERLAQAGSRAGLLLRRFRQEPDRAIAAILILNTVANSGGAAIATAEFENAFPGTSPAVFAALFVVTVLTMTEIVPKTIGVAYANGLAVPVAYVVHTMAVALTPVIVVTRMISRLFTRKQSGHAASLEDIRVLTTVGMSQGAFGTITADLIHNATRLRDTKARDVMVARDRIAYLSGSVSTEENLLRLQRSGHSRLPYTPDGELDHVLGVIMAKELLLSLRERAEPAWQELLIPLLVVPETATLNHVLRRFQKARRHLAIVVDEYGSTRGLITLEDVLEEIVGEIEDESDTEDASMVQKADGSWLCRGTAELAIACERAGVPAPESASVTLSGFLAEQLGHVPTAGDVVDHGGFRFLVTKASNRRAERVLLSQLAPPPDANEAAGGA